MGTITTYSFSKKQNSTKVPTSGGTAHNTVLLKDPTSLIHPVFKLQGFNRTDNYVLWDGRYYFIDDIVQRTNDIAEYHCSVDALASWKTRIGQLSEYVVRSASAHDGSILDMYYPVTADTSYATVTFPTLASSTDLTAGTFVIGIVGKGSVASGGIDYYSLYPYQFKSLLDYMYNGYWLDYSEVDLSLAMQKELVNPFQYIVSAMWFPFTFSGSGGSQDITFGYWSTNDTPPTPPTPPVNEVRSENLRGIQGNLMTVSDRYKIITDSVTVPRHPERSTRGRYLDYSPFSAYYARIWTFGDVVLDPALFVQHPTCQVQFGYDAFNGGGELLIGNSDQKISRCAQVGVPVQISQVSQKPLEGIAQVVGASQSFLGVDIAGGAAGILSAVKCFYPQVDTGGSTGNAISYAVTPNLNCQYRMQTAMDNTHKGRPLCEVRTINTLSGYIQCEDVEVDIECTQEERNIIKQYMESGFYYE